MKRFWTAPRRHFLVPGCALLFQPVPILFIRTVARLAYGEPRWLAESSAWSLSLMGIALCGVISMTLGGLGIYGLLTRSHGPAPRWATATAMIVLCCVPALLAGAVYLRAVLVFLAIV